MYFALLLSSYVSLEWDLRMSPLLGGTTHGTNSTEMATRLHFEDRSSRITPHNAHERKHEIDSTSRRKCLLNGRH